MQPTKMTVTAKAVLDIRDKELLYLIIEHNGKKVAVNVGEKTYSSVKALVDEQTKLPLEEKAEEVLKQTEAQNKKLFTSQPK